MVDKDEYKVINTITLKELQRNGAYSDALAEIANLLITNDKEYVDGDKVIPWRMAVKLINEHPLNKREEWIRWLLNHNFIKKVDISYCFIGQRFTRENESDVRLCGGWFHDKYCIFLVVIGGPSKGHVISIIREYNDSIKEVPMEKIRSLLMGASSLTPVEG